MVLIGTYELRLRNGWLRLPKRLRAGFKREAFVRWDRGSGCVLIAPVAQALSDEGAL